jgi:hypothetical protein
VVKGLGLKLTAGCGVGDQASEGAQTPSSGYAVFLADRMHLENMMTHFLAAPSLGRYCLP